MIVFLSWQPWTSLAFEIEYVQLHLCVVICESSTVLLFVIIVTVANFYLKRSEIKPKLRQVSNINLCSFHRQERSFIKKRTSTLENLRSILLSIYSLVTVMMQLGLWLGACIGPVNVCAACFICNIYSSMTMDSYKCINSDEENSLCFHNNLLYCRPKT